MQMLHIRVNLIRVVLMYAIKSNLLIWSWQTTQKTLATSFIYLHSFHHFIYHIIHPQFFLYFPTTHNWKSIVQISANAELPFATSAQTSSFFLLFCLIAGSLESCGVLPLAWQLAYYWYGLSICCIDWSVPIDLVDK